MIRRSVNRLRRFGRAEIAWRTREAFDIARQRVATSVTAPRWNRKALLASLDRRSELPAIRAALAAERWQDAHVALGEYFSTRPARFVIAPQMRARLVEEISRRFPASVTEAASRGERLLAGKYDLLGYHDMPFDGRSWDRDSVHGKSAPMRFWTRVPFLSDDCGDHKITWELNRHQHWLELGRAYWLTGDARYRAEVIAQLESWREANPPLMGINWASMLELAFRSLSWMWALNFFADASERDRSPWLVDLLLGIDRQLAHVERHLSYYFSPNTHLLGEALALYVAGRTLPELRASARREATGRRVLIEEIGRQIAADGGHCERSLHYHRYTLDFYLFALAVARITDDPMAGVFERTCARLAHAARNLADDTGLLPHIGDDDGGSLLPLTRRPTDDARDSLAIAAALTGHSDLLVDDPPEEMWWVLAHPRFADAIGRTQRALKRVALTSTALPSTGYFISRTGDGDHLIIDGGPHGYMNGGHAHADALALTFTFRGRPLLIDTGTGCYTVLPAVRDRFRSSALHNTLTLDARSQSIPRGPFHWDHVANASARRWRMNRRFDYFAGTHDGYRPLAHRRHVLVMHGDLLVVADAIVGEGPLAGDSSTHRAAVHWHVDPAWAVELGDDAAALSAGSESVRLHVATGALEHFRGDEVSGLGWHSPVYGRIEPVSTLRITCEGRAPFWIVSVFGLDRSNLVQRVAIEPVLGSGNVLHYATAIRIDRERSTEHLLIAEPVDDRRHGLWRTADIDTDARMLFARQVGPDTTALGLVDATTVRSDRYPYLERSYPSRVADVYLTIDHTRLTSTHDDLIPTTRKAS
jgi:hypothetical protein